MIFRHEWKHEINYSDFMTLRARLSCVAKPEEHGTNGVYAIRSLYLDDAYDTALQEKLNGINKREKFRIRYYEGDTTFLRLEKKSKVNGLCNKQQVVITAEEARKIVAGEIQFMREDARPLVRELYSKMRTKGLKPKTIVDYMREAYVFPAGNVRITIDYDIRTGLSSTDFLNPDCIMMPAGEPVIILEVKWDAYLPDIIRDAIGLEGRRATAYSKYAACRIYG